MKMSKIFQFFTSGQILGLIWEKSPELGTGAKPYLSDSKSYAVLYSITRLFGQCSDVSVEHKKYRPCIYPLHSSNRTDILILSNRQENY